MKIGLIRHSMDEPQGGARQVALLARDLRDLGEDVTVYCYSFDQERCFPDILADVSVCAVERTAGRNRSDHGWRRNWVQLQRYYLEAPAIASIVATDCDILNPHEWLAHRAAALSSRRTGTPVVWSYNDPSGWHHAGRGGVRPLPMKVFGWFDTRIVNRFAAVTTLDQRMQAIGRAAFKVPVYIVRSGVDPRVFDACEGGVETRPRTQPGISLLSVGILFPHRRFEDAVVAVHWARQQRVTCSYEIIGSDRFFPAYGASLRALIHELGLEASVKLRLESVSEEELEAAYARADVLLFPNEGQTWGLAVLEALARGIPAIVSRGAGVHEVLTDGENALLVDVKEPVQIAEAIARLARDSSLRRDLGAAGRHLVRESFTSRHYATEMRRLFRDRLDSSRAH